MHARSLGHVPMNCGPPGSSVHGIFFFFFLGKNIGMGGHFLLQGIFLDTGIKPVSPAFQADSSPLSHWETPGGEGKE